MSFKVLRCQSTFRDIYMLISFDVPVKRQVLVKDHCQSTWRDRDRYQSMYWYRDFQLKCRRKIKKDIRWSDIFLFAFLPATNDIVYLPRVVTVLVTLGLAIFLVWDIWSSFQRFIPVGGMAIFVIFLWITSSSPKKVRVCWPRHSSMLKSCTSICVLVDYVHVQCIV